MEKIGIIPVSGKPITCGHFHLINLASDETNTVYLFISLLNRIRKNEFPIYGNSMKIIWEKYLLKILPSNVNVIFCDIFSPIKKIYEILGDVDKSLNKNNFFVIYGNVIDLEKSFSTKSINKYLTNLYKNNLLVRRPVIRINDISGTIMRKFLFENEKQKFINNLPYELEFSEKIDIWNILKNGLNYG